MKKNSTMENNSVMKDSMKSVQKEIAKPKRNKRKIILLLIGLVVLLIIGVRIYQTFAPAEVEEAAVINVKTGTVAYHSLSASSPVTGRIEPIEEVSIMPMAAGEVTAVHVNMGDQVTKGTVLFETDKTQIAASYSQAAASYQLAKKTFENMKVLYQEGAVSLNDYDQAKVQLQSAQSAYTTAADAYGNTRVTSPIDGYVTSLNVSVGSMLSPGAPVASVANVSDLIINATVSEYLVGHLSKNDLVEIRISTLGEQTYQGKVTAISPAPAKGTLTYPVKFSVVNPDGIIKAGMFAEILITSDQREDVLAVPSDAVIVKNGESMVVILEKDIPSYRKITTGLDDGTLVEVTSGLSEGETIVVEGHQFVTENVKVKISE